VYTSYLFTHTHTHTQLFYGSMDFVRDNPGEPVPEETFTRLHLYTNASVFFMRHYGTI